MERSHMGVKTKEEILEQIRPFLNESDEATALLEDLSDTLDESNSEILEENERLKKEKDEIDEYWRKKYRDRFFANNEKEEVIKEEEVVKEKYEDLFKKEV